MPLNFFFFFFITSFVHILNLVFFAEKFLLKYTNTFFLFWQIYMYFEKVRKNKILKKMYIKTELISASQTYAKYHVSLLIIFSSPNKMMSNNVALFY